MRELRKCVLAAAVLGGSVVWAQQPAPPPAATTPCSTSPQPAPCSVDSGSKAQQKPDAADQFPFPGEGSAAPAPSSPAAGDAKPAAPPEAPAAPKAFPFPGEDDAGSSSSSSSSGSGASVPAADTPDSTDAKPAPEGRRLLKRVNPIGEKLQSPEEREAEDLRVAKFYSQTGDPKGAYLRSQDAVKTAPDDPDAHCSLAEAALNLKKRDEAVAEFHACLKLDPVDKQAKNAQKQLARLK